MSFRSFLRSCGRSCRWTAGDSPPPTSTPLAEWLFGVAGLIPGLAIDTGITLVAIGFLMVTRRFAHSVKLGLLGFIAVTTAYAVLNNLTAMRDLGLSPLGVG